MEPPMTLIEARDWIDGQYRTGARHVAVKLFSSHLWLSSSAGPQRLVMKTDDEGVINRMSVDLKDYVRTKERGAAHV